MKNLNLLGLLLIVNTCTYQAVADSYFLSYHEGRTDFDVTANYFKTNSNFSSGGTKSDLPSGYYLQTIDTTVQGRYVLLEDVALSAGFNVANSESNDTIATRTNSTFNKIFISSDFQFYNSSLFNLTGEVSYAQNLEKVAQDTDSVLSSDGANEATAQVGSTLKLNSFFPFFKGGFKYRTEGLSTLLLYAAGAELRFDTSAFGGLVTGFTSIKDDDKTSQAYLRDGLTGRVDAFSKKYYAINPNLLDSEVYFRFGFLKDFAAKIFGGYTILGSNTAAGYHAGATFSWGFGGSSNVNVSRPLSVPSSYSPQPVKHSTQQPKPMNQPHPKGFKEDTDDGVNQDYFKPVSPSNEDIEKEEPTITTKPPPTTAAPSNNPEFKIKLKKLKKKKAPQQP